MTLIESDDMTEGSILPDLSTHAAKLERCHTIDHPSGQEDSYKCGPLLEELGRSTPLGSVTDNANNRGSSFLPPKVPPQSLSMTGDQLSMELASGEGEALEHLVGSPTTAHTTSKTDVSTSSVAICGGCSGAVLERFYLQVGEKIWHAYCLRCHACQQCLDSETSCFLKEGKIFCRKDYKLLFGNCRRCSRCEESLLPSEMVMRARSSIFHLTCFTCAVCQIYLTPGQHFGMVGARPYCRTHYNIVTNTTSSSNISTNTAGGCQAGNDRLRSPKHQLETAANYSVATPISPTTPATTELTVNPLREISALCNQGNQPLTPTKTPPSSVVSLATLVSIKEEEERLAGDNGGEMDAQQRLLHDTDPSSLTGEEAEGAGGTGEGGKQGGKGRSKKRKLGCIDDEEIGMHNTSGEGSTLTAPDANSSAGSGAEGCGGASLGSGGGAGCGGGSSSLSQRQKRVRTSFKHHQLRTMKSYFSMNHNPDAKDLKQLSQKTGLSKRVLQVWFQNARAKFRRSLLKHQQDLGLPMNAGAVGENGSMDPSGGMSGGLSGPRYLLDSQDSPPLSEVSSAPPSLPEFGSPGTEAAAGGGGLHFGQHHQFQPPQTGQQQQAQGHYLPHHLTHHHHAPHPSHLIPQQQPQQHHLTAVHQLGMVSSSAAESMMTLVGPGDHLQAMGPGGGGGSGDFFPAMSHSVNCIG